MQILGIDPGINNTGWAIINYNGRINYIASGTIKTDANLPLGTRLFKICNTLEDIISQYKPQIAGLEEVFVNKNFQSSLKLSHARGAIMLTIAKFMIPLNEFAPNLVKKTVTGVGRAEKTQVQHMINIIISQAKFLNADEADALAIAYTCHIMNKFQIAV